MPRSVLLVATVVVVVAAVVWGMPPPTPLRNNSLALTPPMGWMSWEMFRCDVDCSKEPDHCINEALYKAQTDSLVSGGFLDAGYNGIHIDDCWMRRDPPRDASGKLSPDPDRFPSGFKALGDYMHAKGVRFAIYTAESPHTCAGYPASAGHESTDADTFASWGVDYLKVDGCGDNKYYPTGYPLMGKALQNSGRPIAYSCSWPAYIGSNESVKPFQTFIDIGCNLWRNWADIQCSWSSLSSIIDHWGDWGPVISKFAGPGHWNDPDMLLIGNDCISDDEARTQMAMWSIFAAPLIMGNDLRTVNASQRAILLNKEAIAVNQDAKGVQGLRVSPKGNTEVWSRPLSDGALAVGLYNKNGGAPTPGPHATCDWNVTQGGYLEACGGSGGDEDCFGNVDLAAAQAHCCQDDACAGFSFDAGAKSGCYKRNTDCGLVKGAAYTGYNKPGFKPPTGGPSKITVTLSDLGLSGSVAVRDLWAQKDLGTFTGSFSAVVPLHGTGFFRMKQQ